MSLLGGGQHEAVHEGGQGAADQRGQDEDPHLGQSLAAGQQGRAEGTSRVDRGAGERQAEDHDGGQGQADDDAGDVLANIHSAISLFVDEPAPMGAQSLSQPTASAGA